LSWAIAVLDCDPSSSDYAWAAKLDADLDSGGISPDQRFFPNGDDFRGLRVHQTRLEAGDASSDSYCFTS
jgi:selenium-binding protein 1